MSRALAPLALALALAPVSAGASAPTPIALTAAPARLVLDGSETGMVRIRNAGSKRVAVDAALAGFALDLRGRPRIVSRRGARSAAAWLRVRPAHLTLGPRSTARLRVFARVPRGAEAGDHDALVLLAAHPLATARVSVRLRLGVVVVVRAPGAVVRRLKLGPLRLARRGARATLELMVVNAGNVTERLLHARTVIWRRGTRRRLATVLAGARELRPRTRGLLVFPVRTRAHGAVTTRVVIPGEPGRPAVRRTYRVRL